MSKMGKNCWSCFLSQPCKTHLPAFNCFCRDKSLDWRFRVAPTEFLLEGLESSDILLVAEILCNRSLLSILQTFISHLPTLKTRRRRGRREWVPTPTYPLTPSLPQTTYSTTYLKHEGDEEEGQEYHPSPHQPHVQVQFCHKSTALKRKELAALVDVIEGRGGGVEIMKKTKSLDVKKQVQKTS